MKYLIFLFTLMTLIGCSKNEEVIDNFLACSQIEENYQAYNGEEINCQFHYVLTEYNNQQYIELVAYCADLLRPYVINENCEDICEFSSNDVNSECNKYINNREVIKTILIHK